MSRLARVLAVAFLAAFPVGSAAHAAAAAEMSIRMSLSEMDDGGMPECQHCPNTGGQDAACAKTCMLGLSAIYPPASPVMAAAGSISPTVPKPFADGQSGHPDPHPPRATF